MHAFLWSSLSRLALLLLMVSACGRRPAARSSPALEWVPATDDVLLQVDWRPGYLRSAELSRLNRFPPFSLYADGTLHYIADGADGADRIMHVQLSSAETQALQQQVLDLGLERLESYTKHCLDSACVADGTTTFLRARLPSGELRELEFYALFANEPETLAAISELLHTYEHPQATSYMPESASLSVWVREDTSEEALPWPLDPIWLPSASDSSPRRRLAGEDLKRFFAAVPGNLGYFVFQHESQHYNAHLVSWPRGVDYSAHMDPSPALSR